MKNLNNETVDLNVILDQKNGGILYERLHLDSKEANELYELANGNANQRKEFLKRVKPLLSEQQHVNLFTENVTISCEFAEKKQ